MKYGFPFIFVFWLLLTSCSGSPPGILNTDWMVVFTEDKVLGSISQELNFFIQLQDDDGEADISELYLIRDDLNWSWKMDSSNWVTSSIDGEFWLGANGLTMGSEDLLPTGDYRILVIDRSGQRDELTVSIRQPDIKTSDLVFPRVNQQGRTIQLDFPLSPLVLWFYDSQAQLVAEKYLQPGNYLMEDILNSEEIQKTTWFYVYFQNERQGYGQKSGPYLFDGQ